MPPIALPAVSCVRERAHVCSAEPAQKTAFRMTMHENGGTQQKSKNNTQLQADAIENLLEILSANTPVPSTPKRQPSSSTAAA